MAHMRNKKGEFRRGFGRGPKQKIQSTQTKAGGREVLIPVARLLEAMKEARRRKVLVRSPPREVRDLVKPLKNALAGAEEKGIHLKEELGVPPSCPTTLIRNIVDGASRLNKMRPKALETAIGKDGAQELKSALKLAMPKLRGIERLCA